MGSTLAVFISYKFAGNNEKFELCSFAQTKTLEKKMCQAQNVCIYTYISTCISTPYMHKSIYIMAMHGA